MTAHRDIWNYFLLINHKTKERYLCSWGENEPDFYGQKVNFIGITENGLGGYRQMLSNGFIDRRFEKYTPELTKVQLFKIKKRRNGFRTHLSII